MAENGEETGMTSRSQLGMMVGMILGIGMGSSLFVITNDPVWFSLAGVGIALGLGIGSYLEGQEKDE